MILEKIKIARSSAELDCHHFYPNLLHLPVGPNAEILNRITDKHTD
jgi:hypothetical protein